jgi:uncharacterized protein involved in response to NO
MNPNRPMPPRWAENLLEHLLPEHTREDIVGDLREEYAEALLPRYGRFGADLRYVRHVLSFLPAATRESTTMGVILIGVSVITAICMFWLAAMEIVLRHPLYAHRAALDVVLGLVCLATICIRLLHPPRTLDERSLRGIGFLLILFGALAFFQNAGSAHFEGFVFVISLLLMLQGVLMLLTLGRIVPGDQSRTSR